MRNAVVRSQGTTRENRPRVASRRRGRFSLAIGAAGLQLTLNQSWSSSPQLSISFTSLSSLEWSGRFVSDVIVARISIS